MLVHTHTHGNVGMMNIRQQGTVCKPIQYHAAGRNNIIIRKVSLYLDQHIIIIKATQYAGGMHPYAFCRVQSTYPYNDNLYNDITPITIFSHQTKSSCSVSIHFFTLITIWPKTTLPL